LDLGDTERCEEVDTGSVQGGLGFLGSARRRRVVDTTYDALPTITLEAAVARDLLWIPLLHIDENVDELGGGPRRPTLDRLLLFDIVITIEIVKFVDGIEFFLNKTSGEKHRKGKKEYEITFEALFGFCFGLDLDFDFGSSLTEMDSEMSSSSSESETSESRFLLARWTN